MVSFTLFLFVGFLIPVSAVKPQQSNASLTSVSLVFTDAYYADLDGDGFEDDVFGGVDFHITGQSRVTFDYHITLVMPSGLSWTYSYRIHTKYSYLHFDNFFYDHAVESGDYHFEVDIILRTGGVSHAEYNHVFDPPGGSTGDATFVLMYHGY